MKDKDYEMLAKRMAEDAWMRGCDIALLVEDIYDQRLWECIIENVKPELRDKIDFPNPVPKRVFEKLWLMYQIFLPHPNPAPSKGRELDFYCFLPLQATVYTQVLSVFVL